MFIDINKIGPEGVELDTSLDLPELEGPSGEALEVRSNTFVARVLKGSRGAEIRGNLDAVVQVVCSRCLEKLDEKVHADFFLLAVSEIETVEDGKTVDEEEEEAYRESLLSVADGRLDLAAVAQEQIYLNLSRKPICSTECRGLCPGCGVNRNSAECRCDQEEIDPRLAPLLKFRKN
jgi:uncharacterized protein